MVIDEDGKDRTGRNIHGHDGGQNQEGPVSHNCEKESHLLSSNDGDMSHRQEGKLIAAVLDVSAEGDSSYPKSSSSSSYPSKRRRVSSESSDSTTADGHSSIFMKDTNDVQSGRDQTMVTATIKDVTTNGSYDLTTINAAAVAAAVPAAKLDLMPSKALEKILEFLHVSPREMFVLVTSIKPFYDSIQSRPDIVVKINR